MNILVIGPQASGKGTQADLLAKKLGVPHLSTGDLFRAEKRTALGRRIAAIMDAGELVPDEVTWQMIKAHLDEEGDGWVLDGFPRTLNQAALLDAHAAPDKVLVLDTPDEICIERISGRRICETCGKDYHVKYKPPKRADVCDLDGGELVQRPDDNEEAVKRRLATYHEQTEPLLIHYADRLITVDGSPGIDDVWQSIQEKLGL